MNIDPNAPAYPIADYTYPNGEVQWGSNGLSIRAEIASRIHAQLLPTLRDTWSAKDIAVEALYHTEALITELNKTPQ